MESKKIYPLVDGSFKAAEAREVLMNLIGSKIAFHSVKNMSSLERNGEADAHSERRIEELQLSRKEIRELLKIAEEDELQVRISSGIHISLEEK